MSAVLMSIAGVAFVILLTFGTAVAVAAEFSLTALERSTVETHVAEVGGRRAETLRRAHRTLAFQLSGAQVAITLTTLLTGYVAQPLLADLISPGLRSLGASAGLAETVAMVLAMFLATGLSMVFGEMVPKNLAIARPLGTARAVAGYHARFSGLFRWLINVMNNSANWLVRRLGVEPQEELRSARSPAELGSIVRSSAEHGTLDESTAQLLDKSLQFGDRTADELMTPRVQVASLATDATVPDLIELSRRTGLSRFPVHGGDLDDVLGIVHVKQAFGVEAEHRPEHPVSALVRPVPSVPESLGGDALLNQLRGAAFQMALVVDEYGGTAGIVTLEDVVEEIIGDVRDEHDRREATPVRKLGRHGWVVSGLLRSDEVREATGLRMPDGDYETVAGLVLERLGRIPEVGAEIRLDGWRLTVLRMDRHRIAELRLTREAGRREEAETSSARGRVPAPSAAVEGRR